MSSITMMDGVNYFGSHCTNLPWRVHRGKLCKQWWWGTIDNRTITFDSTFRNNIVTVTV